MPVAVWKQVKRKWDDSRTSIPVGRCGASVGVPAGTRGSGDRLRVIA